MDLFRLVGMALTELRNDIVLMFEMQRLYAEMQYQLMMLKEHAALLPTEDAQGGSSSSAALGDGMDVDADRKVRHVTSNLPKKHKKKQMF